MLGDHKSLVISVKRSYTTYSSMLQTSSSIFKSISSIMMKYQTKEELIKSIALNRLNIKRAEEKRINLINDTLRKSRDILHTEFIHNLKPSAHILLNGIKWQLVFVEEDGREFLKAFNDYHDSCHIQTKLFFHKMFERISRI